VPLVVHYCADLQSVHGFCCCDNIHVCKLIALYTANAYSGEREMSASARTRSMSGYYYIQLLVFSYYYNSVTVYFSYSHSYN